MIVFYFYLFGVVWLFVGYTLWLSSRAVLLRDYVGVVISALVLAALWPVYLVGIVGRSVARNGGG